MQRDTRGRFVRRNPYSEDEAPKRGGRIKVNVDSGEVRTNDKPRRKPVRQASSNDTPYYEGTYGDDVRGNNSYRDSRIDEQPSGTDSELWDDPNFMGVYDDDDEYTPYDDFNPDKISPRDDYEQGDYYGEDTRLRQEDYDWAMDNSPNGYVDDVMASPPRERMRQLRKGVEGIRDYSDGSQSIGVHRNDYDEDNVWDSGPNYDSEEAEYLDYLEQYHRGEIDNYQMSKIQREYANSSFWNTFNPSRKLIEQYGSGEASTRYPMFERKNGRWRPVFWRND